MGPYGSRCFDGITATNELLSAFSSPATHFHSTPGYTVIEEALFST